MYSEGVSREGFGADLESEEVLNTSDTEEALLDFDAAWRTPDNEDVFDAVLAKIRTKKDQEAISAEIRRLDHLLVETQGDDDEINNILTKYAGGKGSSRGADEDMGEEE